MSISYESTSKNLRSQNCGVVVKGDVLSGEKEYFGLLQEVVELEYDSKHKVVLFKCDWFDVYTDNIGIKREEYGITSVNAKRFLKTNEPFVLASQVEQVYYVRDHIHQNWQVVVKTNPRNFYDIPSDDEDEEAKSIVDGDDAVQEAYIPLANDGTTSLVRNDLNPDVIDATIVTQELQRHNKKGKMAVVDAGSESESSDEDNMKLFADKLNNEFN